ncbi:dihydroxy-acid dehydratase, partial [Terrisporobacter mayombei]|uniref:dihydroxy-acid dehydratase domain-containing protein n=1 Tax=Terrisporobacter mayombei TaxID=1541 RepID=UPI00265948B3|nr:dihydroxy-acid dehydratase [Terrisporobacter mayombei]
MCPSHIMTREALENTITLLSAIGVSLNALIHLPALAAELGISLDWDDFSKITTTTPVLCSIVPNGNRTVVDLH